MAARTVIPTRSTGDSPALHLQDHLKMHAEYNKFAVSLAKTASYTLVAGTDGLVTFNGTSLVATLPTPVGNGGETFVIKNLHATSLLTVATAAGSIDGLSAKILKPGDSLRVTSNDTIWVGQGGISSTLPVLSVKDYGAVGDGVRLFGAVASSASTSVQVTGASFTQADVGKSAIVYNDSSGGVATTIASVVDAQNITLAANAGVTTTSANGYLIYGTDDSAAIQTALTAAAAMVSTLNTTNPNQPMGSGHAVVLAPGNGTNSLYIVSSVLTIGSGVEADFAGTVANLLTSRNAPVVKVSPFAIVQRLEVECTFGNGVDCGTNGQQAHIVLGDVRVWHCKGSSTAITDLAGGTSATGGTLSANTRYYVVTSIDASGGESLVSNEVSVTSTGSTSSNSFTWTAVSGAASYRIYRGTASGAQNLYFTSATNSFTDTGGASTSDYPVGPGVALVLRGYHYEARHLWAKIARLGIYHRAGSDCIVNAAYVVGCTTGVRMNASNQVRYTSLLLDTCGGSGSLGGLVLDNGCTNIKVNAQAFQVSGVATSLTPVVNIGPLTSTTKQVFCDIDVNAALTGGTVLSLANAQDCRFKVMAVNTAYSSAGGAAITTAVVYGSGLVAAIDVTLFATPGITSTSGTQVGTLTNPAAASTGVQSTVGLGLPTTTGRSDGDLHFDKAGQREYTLVNGAWQATSGAVNTVAAGLPAFSGRVAGDHHFNSTEGRDYVLTGAAGSTISDDFSSNSLAAYSTAGMSIAGGKVSQSSTSGYALRNLTVATGLTVQAEVTFGPSGAFASFDLVGVGASANSTNTTGYYFAYRGDEYLLFRNGSGVGTTYVPTTLPYSTTVTMAISVSGGVVTCYVNGIAVITYTDATPLTGTYGGLIYGSTAHSNAATWDNLYAFTTGTLAWTPGSSGPSSTTGLGLPTTSGRSAGDLHYNLITQRQYELVTVSGALTWVASAGSLNTSASGLPTFNGRVAGDHAFDVATGRDYVLTGAAAGTASVALVGGVVNTSATQMLDLGTATGATSISCRVNNDLASDNCRIYFDGDNASRGFWTQGYFYDIISSSVKIYPYNGGSPLAVGSLPAGVSVGSPNSYDLTIDNNAGHVVVKVNGVTVLDATITAYSGRYVSVEPGGATPAISVTNVIAQKAGTLAWTLSQSSAETIKHIAASGAAVTVDNPITTGTTLTRAVLSASCAFTLPAPGTAGTTVGKSFTVVVVQAASGGPYTSTFSVPSGNILWGAAGTPTQSTAASAGDMYVFTDAGGGNLLGTYVQGF